MATFKELREKYPVFTFDRYEVTEDENSFSVTYFFEIEQLANFSPTWIFPKSKKIKTSLENETLQKLLFGLGMVELVSYWKLTCSPKIVVKAASLTEKQINWWKDLYFHGLGEFFYVNGIQTDLSSFVKIEAVGEDIKGISEPRANKGTLIPVGGGKDSSVTMELLRESKKDNYCFAINPRGAVLWSVEAGGYQDKLLAVKRTLDPKMLLLNKEGFLNGHTPFSALVAFSSVITAFLHGLRYVALSNESSANESTVPGSMVNHQYSKSFRFEKAFTEYEKEYADSGVSYYSLLRPLSEFQIAWYFAGCTQYHEVFRSCNAGSKTDSWCCNCPKCLFVFMILSPFIELERLTQMFGENLLDKESLTVTFEELLGIREVKPFECVGSREEVNTALALFIKKRLEEKKTLPYLAQRYVDQKLYEKQIAKPNPYMSYYEQENLLPPEMDQMMRSIFLKEK